MTQAPICDLFHVSTSTEHVEALLDEIFLDGTQHVALHWQGDLGHHDQLLENLWNKDAHDRFTINTTEMHLFQRQY